MELFDLFPQINCMSEIFESFSCCSTGQFHWFCIRNFIINETCHCFSGSCQVRKTMQLYLLLLLFGLIASSLRGSYAAGIFSFPPILMLLLFSDYNIETQAYPILWTFYFFFWIRMQVHQGRRRVQGNNENLCHFQSLHKLAITQNLGSRIKLWQPCKRYQRRPKFVRKT